MNNELWKSGRALSLNCYAYMVSGHECQPRNNIPLEPGFAGAGERSKHPDYRTRILSRSASELIQVTAAEGSFPPPREGYYIGAILINTEGSISNHDFHCIRQNIDGSWSSKRATEEPTTLDKSGKLITDPRTANYNYTVNSTIRKGEVQNINYKFQGFFYVPNAGISYRTPETTGTHQKLSPLASTELAAAQGQIIA